jgi:hypothetical protein
VETRKVYVDEYNKAELVCPHCGASRHINVSKLNVNGSPLRIKCICKAIFLASFEFRRSYRKETNFFGYYCIPPFCKDWHEMKVKNISQSGIGFAVHGRHRLKVGDAIKVKFKLDDRSHSDIEKDVIVRRVSSDYLGCEFSCRVQFDKALGFYLMP